MAKKKVAKVKKKIEARAEERSEPLHQRIAMRAYQLYLARGAVEGDALLDWLEAEREIGGENGSGDSP